MNGSAQVPRRTFETCNNIQLGLSWCSCLQVAETLHEAVLLAGFFAAGRAAHRERLQWGRAPTLLTRLCALPAPYFQLQQHQDIPAATPPRTQLPDVLLPTLAAACIGVPRNCAAVDELVGLHVLHAYARARNLATHDAEQGAALPSSSRTRNLHSTGDATVQQGQGLQSKLHAAFSTCASAAHALDRSGVTAEHGEHGLADAAQHWQHHSPLQEWSRFVPSRRVGRQEWHDLLRSSGADASEQSEAEPCAAALLSQPARTR